MHTVTTIGFDSAKSVFQVHKLYFGVQFWAPVDTRMPSTVSRTLAAAALIAPASIYALEELSQPVFP